MLLRKVTITLTWQFFENCQILIFTKIIREKYQFQYNCLNLILDNSENILDSGYILALPVCDLLIITITIHENVNFLDFLGHGGWAIWGSELLCYLVDSNSALFSYGPIMK